ncbi:MAG: isochorismatase family protein [Bacteroidales bacterium]|nr:isochorismatase family protein [Bacteroidales bacterium]
MKRRLFIVDPQNGFMDDGTLPVKGSLDKMAALAKYLHDIELEYYDKIYISLDWHPINHCSFSEQGGPWPSHCVGYTADALVTDSVLNELKRWMQAGKVEYIRKGEQVERDEYSALDNENVAAHLAYELRKADHLDVCGVVGTVCVQNTLKGLIEKATSAEKITALTAYIAQFDTDSEKAFVKWCEENGIAVA